MRQKCFEGADADVGTSGSRGSTGKAGGVTGEKTAKGLRPFRMWAVTASAERMSRELELLVSWESCWSKESSGKGGEPVMEKGRKAFQKMLHECVVETGEVPTHCCREEGK